MILLGIDIGSSSIKTSLFDGEKGMTLASATFPVDEMPILSINKNWAEQNPEDWFDNLKKALKAIRRDYAKELRDVGAIGITYQMHGLVMVDRKGNLVRNSIIWCDSRAANIGDQAFQDLGEEYCLSHYLNSPGNFTASKLRWVQLHEPEQYKRIAKIMLPGDYIAYRLTGEISTSTTGLSEGIFWDFKEGGLAKRLLDFYGIQESLIAKHEDSFTIQGRVSAEMASELGLSTGTPVAYRAGDQPNNAFSLNVLEPGEIATTAGTSGVIYGVTNREEYDPKSRVNTFLHVNHTSNQPRYGILMCLNSTGILNSWAKHQLGDSTLTYERMNQEAQTVPIGSEGLQIFPFGNGAERILQNKNLGATISGLNFNIHQKPHIYRAVQEGIIFALYYGLEIMQSMGMEFKVIRAGKANMFLSELFRQTLADLSGASIELYHTTGAEGAARGAGVGVGFYQDTREAFQSLTKLETINPRTNEKLQEVYANWKEELNKKITSPLTPLPF